MEILAVKNLTFSYPQAEKEALKDISFSIEAGDYAVLCGATGSGKSTLLRMLKRELAPLGERSGCIVLNGTDTQQLSERESAESIGFVMQRPQQQLVTDKVWHELAFGLENLGMPQSLIRRRVAEMSSYFGIEDWFDRSVNELSGGQMQLLNLASVMVMQPDILILDEPTAQLDPIAASEFLSTVSKLNEELALTVIIAEHRLEEIIPRCDKLLVMKDGCLSESGKPREVCEKLRNDRLLLEALPSAVRLYSELNSSAPCPLTIREARRFITDNFDTSVRRAEPGAEAKKNTAGDTALELKDVFFRYSRNEPDVLRGTSLTVKSGEIMCILGGNGSGKSTALCCAAGLLHPYSGKIKVFGKKLRDYKGQSLYKDCLAMLPQDVQTVFLFNTVRKELEDVSADVSSLPYDITPLMDKHPYDLSGGEQQLVALAKVLAAKPKLLLLDEPTKGIDAHTKAGIADILLKLKASGITIVAVTHDTEFSALCADRCAMFFRGEITCCENPHDFFCGNTFYTTAANRMTRGIFDGVITVSEAARLCLENTRSGGDEE